MKTLSLTALLLTLLCGCAALGVPAPQTFNEKEAAAIVTTTGIVKTANALLQADKIKPEDAASVVKQTDVLMEAISVADTIHATDPAAGENRLAAVIVSLNALSTYLATRK